MDVVKLMTERLKHEIDKSAIKQLGEVSGVDMKDVIDIMTEKFNTALVREMSGMTNEKIHEKGNL